MGVEVVHCAGELCHPSCMGMSFLEKMGGLFWIYWLLSLTGYLFRVCHDSNQYGFLTRFNSSWSFPQQLFFLNVCANVYEVTTPLGLILLHHH